jgi:hypothetical protein
MTVNDNPRAAIEAELLRTAFQRKAVSPDSFDDAIADAIRFFKEHGYRSGRAGRPNQVFIMGAREGPLPRVTAELTFQANVGKNKITMVTISGAGENLSRVLAEYAGYLRDRGRAKRAGGA